jgi:hypothetical protein
MNPDCDQVPAPAAPAGSEGLSLPGDQPRFAIYLDLESLTKRFVRLADWDGTKTAIAEVVARFSERGQILVKVAACSHWLSDKLNPALVRKGFEVLMREGYTPPGWLLIPEIEENLPDDCNTVVIGSNDSRFIEVAQLLKARGKQVEGLTTDLIGPDFYRLLDAHHYMRPPLSGKRKEKGRGNGTA